MHFKSQARVVVVVYSACAGQAIQACQLIKKGRGGDVDFEVPCPKIPTKLVEKEACILLKPLTAKEHENPPHKSYLAPDTVSGWAFAFWHYAVHSRQPTDISEQKD